VLLLTLFCYILIIVCFRDCAFFSRVKCPWSDFPLRHCKIDSLHYITLHCWLTVRMEIWNAEKLPNQTLEISLENFNNDQTNRKARKPTPFPQFHKANDKTVVTRQYTCNARCMSLALMLVLRCQQTCTVALARCCIWLCRSAADSMMLLSTDVSSTASEEPTWHPIILDV